MSVLTYTNEAWRIRRHSAAISASSRRFVEISPPLP